MSRPRSRRSADPGRDLSHGPQAIADIARPVHERASQAAAPPTETEAPATVARRLRPSARSLTRLRDQQRQFLLAVTDPVSAAHGHDRATAAGLALVSSPDLPAVDRLRIYHFAYQARLVECLADDYPAVRAALGTDAFDVLARTIIQRRPSTTSNLNGYGAVVVEHLCTTRSPLPHRAFLHDLARLEWALVEAVHAPRGTPFDPAALTALPPARWAGIRLARGPSAALLDLRHPVSDWYRSWRRSGDAPAIPKAAASPVVVYRTAAGIQRMDLTETTRDLLADLWAGRPLGEALERLLARVPAARQAELAQRVLVWFREWVAGGLFTLRSTRRR